jgi:hypothetical protein
MPIEIGGQRLRGDRPVRKLEPVPIDVAFRTLEPIPIDVAFRTLEPVPIDVAFRTLEPVPIDVAFRTLEPVPIDVALRTLEPVPIDGAFRTLEPVPIRAALCPVEPTPTDAVGTKKPAPQPCRSDERTRSQLGLVRPTSIRATVDDRGAIEQVVASADMEKLERGPRHEPCLALVSSRRDPARDRLALLECVAKQAADQLEAMRKT